MALFKKSVSVTTVQRSSIHRDIVVFLSGFSLAFLLVWHHQAGRDHQSTHKQFAPNTSPPAVVTQQHRDQQREAPIEVAETRREDQKSFYDIGVKYGTDKVEALNNLQACLENEQRCTNPGSTRVQCRPWGHYYQTIYQSKLSQFTGSSVEPFQFLEIGFLHGAGFHTFTDFLSDKAEPHSIEYGCEGQADKNPNYQTFLDKNMLHCGDASQVSWLHELWTTKIRRPGAPPLKLVIDDGSHLSKHMVQSIFFWFPRIEPGGMLIVEDIQPTNDSNLFRTQFLPQIMSDLHFCGDPKESVKDEPCFALLWKLLQSIHCEMHICIFERNNEPAQPDLPPTEYEIPHNALNLSLCYSYQHSFGKGME